MSANFAGNTLTQSEAIETYTPYDVTSSRNCIFCQLWRDRKIILRAGQELKFENYESVQHGLQFSGIKKGAKISFHRHFKASGGLITKGWSAGSCKNLFGPMIVRKSLTFRQNKTRRPIIVHKKAFVTI